MQAEKTKARNEESSRKEAVREGLSVAESRPGRSFCEVPSGADRARRMDAKAACRKGSPVRTSYVT
ncbi:MAG TPA: hypothetical protein DCZ20_08660 [Lachnospiraceae bacterium]|nr:hypothetical protein [Lachnospiraceae bacterium]